PDTAATLADAGRWLVTALLASFEAVPSVVLAADDGLTAADGGLTAAATAAASGSRAGVTVGSPFAADAGRLVASCAGAFAA
ncbi:unnamed protein product, partial [Rotaria magnacalcarata]